MFAMRRGVAAVIGPIILSLAFPARAQEGVPFGNPQFTVDTTTIDPDAPGGKKFGFVDDKISDEIRNDLIFINANMCDATLRAQGIDKLTQEYSKILDEEVIHMSPVYYLGSDWKLHRHEVNGLYRYPSPEEYRKMVEFRQDIEQIQQVREWTTSWVEEAVKRRCKLYQVGTLYSRPLPRGPSGFPIPYPEPQGTPQPPAPVPHEPDERQEIGAVPWTPGTRLYVRFNGGPTFLPSTDQTTYFTDGNATATLGSDAGFNVGTAIGSQWGPWRFEGEAGFRQNGARNLSAMGVNLPIGGHTQAFTFMGNTIYDFALQPGWGMWTPHLGVGVGVAQVSTRQNFAGTQFFSSRDTQFAYQAIAGVRYPLSGNWSADLDYRYLATAGLNYRDLAGNKVNSSYGTHNVVLSLTYSFGVPPTSVASK